MSDPILYQIQRPGPRRRHPEWLKIRLASSPEYARVKTIVDEHQLHTVCQEAHCPN